MKTERKARRLVMMLGENGENADAGKRHQHPAGTVTTSGNDRPLQQQQQQQQRQQQQFPASAPPTQLQLLQHLLFPQGTSRQTIPSDLPSSSSASHHQPLHPFPTLPQHQQALIAQRPLRSSPVPHSGLQPPSALLAARESHEQPQPLPLATSTAMPVSYAHHHLEGPRRHHHNHHSTAPSFPLANPLLGPPALSTDSNPFFSHQQKQHQHQQNHQQLQLLHSQILLQLQQQQTHQHQHQHQHQQNHQQLLAGTRLGPPAKSQSAPLPADSFPATTMSTHQPRQMPVANPLISLGFSNATPLLPTPAHPQQLLGIHQQLLQQQQQQQQQSASNARQPSATERFQCPTCYRSYARREHLSRHMRSHKSKKHWFKCTRCSRRFYRRDHLNYHLTSHDITPRYICAQTACQESFAHKRELIRHQSESLHFGILYGQMDKAGTVAVEERVDEDSATTAKDQPDNTTANHDAKGQEGCQQSSRGHRASHDKGQNHDFDLTNHSKPALPADAITEEHSTLSPLTAASTPPSIASSFLLHQDKQQD